MNIHLDNGTDTLAPALEDFEILAPESCKLYERSVKQLESNLKSMIHTLIIAPRGYGKQQMVAHVVEKVVEEDPSLRTCHIDLAGINSPEGFLRAFQAGIREIPANSVSVYQDDREIDEILFLPEFSAVKCRFKLICTIGNMHLLFRFDPEFTLLKRMRIIWKESKHCVFCFYGNLEQVQRELLKHRRRIIFGFVKVIKLPQPDFESIFDGITNQFTLRGKRIRESAARSAILHCDKNPYYIRLLTWHAFLRTKTECTSQELEQALSQLIDHYKIYFQQKAESLTLPQLNFLRAYLNQWSRLCSGEEMKKFGLGSSSRIARIKDSLRRKEIIDVFHREIFVTDPLFCHWLKSDYFR